MGKGPRLIAIFIALVSFMVLYMVLLYTREKSGASHVLQPISVEGKREASVHHESLTTVIFPGSGDDNNANGSMNITLVLLNKVVNKHKIQIEEAEYKPSAAPMVHNVSRAGKSPNVPKKLSVDGKKLDEWYDVPEKLKSMQPEVFKFTRRNRLPNFKNPCWYSKQHHKNLACLPYVFVLGVTKCGTSSLWEKLMIHPQFSTPILKESHWWTQRRFGSNPERSFQAETQRGVFGLDLPTKTSNYSKKVIIDASPSTFWDNHQWRQQFVNESEGPPYVVADLIHAVLPKAKLIVTLREPVSRLYSSYKFFRHQGANPKEFNSRVEMKLQQFQNCLTVNSLRACAYQDNVAYQLKRLPRDNTLKLRIGIYHVFLEDWLRVYPRDQLFVLEVGDLELNCIPTVTKLFNFLELDTIPSSDIKRVCSLPRKNVSKYTVMPLWNSTKALLQTFYQPYNERLHEILTASKFDWRYDLEG